VTVVDSSSARWRWQPIMLPAIFALGAYAQATGGIASVLKHTPDIIYLVQQQLRLVGASTGIAIVLGIGIGIWLTRERYRRFADVVLPIVNIGATIPTLAKLAVAMAILGIGAPAAIFGLSVLTLLPIVSNTISGLRAIPPALIEAARGMGMTQRQILWQVELPNALFVILAGIRTALVINVGTAPLAFLIGAGGLGELIFTGIDLMEPGMLLAGAIPTALLAMAADFLVGQIQYWLIPRGVNPLR
jgi:osmoprotectant transport system permease protein